jgi:prefoldin alpha subunit
MNDEETIQRYAGLIEYYKNQLNVIEQQFSFLQATINDYSQAKLTIEKMKDKKNGSEILIPIGGGTFTFAETKDTSKILTDVGAGIVVEKNPDESLAILTKRIETLQANQESLSNLSQQISSQMEEISKKAQDILQKNNKPKE